MTREEMPIFSRTFDFLTWLLPATNHFPRAHRHSFTQRLCRKGVCYTPLPRRRIVGAYCIRPICVYLGQHSA